MCTLGDIGSTIGGAVVNAAIVILRVVNNIDFKIKREVV